ncbi:hypothetical protein HOD83_00515 [Candidatus Woesearchaeota archaeon]|jgi:2-(3-amino-3-carboxypropyl)histidine synthase|nr:hypothetical protein [Candidatus Woesearchaeota archaeon]MBT4114286.1 hypothetical protein [Candidatus Woesearchaeota archaeon]MBT4248059.1 hypothetical protein [Candidatus Woesearchaeota archaeon]
MRTLFIEAHSNQDIMPALKKNLSSLRKYTRIGLFTTVQHIDQLEKATKLLVNNQIQVQVSKSNKAVVSQGVRSAYVGQILGCDATGARNMKVDAFLYIGSGEFHPLAIAIESEKPVLKLNPFTKVLSQISEQDRRRWLAKQAARLDKLKHATRVGIILSSKPGQYKPQIAERLQKRFKNAYVFIADLVTPSDLLNFPDIDAWINTACPRLVEDSWPKPLVNADEIQ